MATYGKNLLWTNFRNWIVLVILEILGQNHILVYDWTRLLLKTKIFWKKKHQTMIKNTNVIFICSIWNYIEDDNAALYALCYSGINGIKFIDVPKNE